MDTLAPYTITRYDSFQVIAQECPQATELFAEYGLHCANCFMNEYDTVETGAQLHGMDEAAMLDMLHEINGELEKAWRRLHAQPLR